MPSTSDKFSEILGMEPPRPGLLSEPEALLNLVHQGAQTTKPKALFPRVDTAKVKAKAEKAAAKIQEKKPAKTKKKKAPQGPAPEVTIDEFGRLDLKLGKVLEAENIKGADRILKLKIDLGEEKPRQVVAGIALHYKPEDLVGKQVVVVANLKPVTLKGVESRGMVLTAVGDDTVRVVAPDIEFSPGSTVR
jgi:methionyl-tRNA synthetase